MAHLDTVRKIVDAARILLQDTVETYRYPDANYLSALNDAMLEVRRLRPDLFIATNFVPADYTDYNAVITFEPMYRTALTYYVAGKVQLVDDETTQDARATVFLNKFAAQLAITPS